MWNLIRFLTSNSPFFTWLLLAVICVIFLFQGNPYQRGVWYSSSNVVVGGVYDVSNSITGYFGLRGINEDLLLRMGQIEEENLRLRQLLQAQTDLQTIQNDTVRQYKYTIAHVVSNSVTQTENFITIDKGSNDGICPFDGVADQNGVVGIVSQVGDNYSCVISLLNPRLRISAGIKGNDSFGSLVWDGGDIGHALLEDLPRNSHPEPGDTVWTTGYSRSFPQGILIGRIKKLDDAADNNFLVCEVELFTDFGRINNVNVISNRDAEEQRAVEPQP